MIKSTCSNLSFSEPEPHHQQNLEEAMGILLQLLLKNGFCIAVFAWGAVSLPPEMEPRLRDLIGRKISILKYEGKYLIRDREAENAA